MSEYKRLTTNEPAGNVETMRNYARIKDGEVFIYDEEGNDVKLIEYIAKQAQDDCGMTAGDIMEGCCFECMDCSLGLLNTTAIQAAELRHRLSELEDKLEAGTLVELPCKVGDMVYIVGRKYRAGSYEGFINTGKFRYSDMEKIGDNIFLTREAAEARLKELEEKGR